MNQKKIFYALSLLPGCAPAICLLGTLGMLAPSSPRPWRGIARRSNGKLERDCRICDSMGLQGAREEGYEEKSMREKESGAGPLRTCDSMGSCMLKSER